MDNMGLKRGYPNNSGLLRVFSGMQDIPNKTNLFPSKGIEYPNFTVPMPYYENNDNKKFMLSYMNDDIKKKQQMNDKNNNTPIRIQLPEVIPQQGGELTKSYYNNI